MLGHYIRKFKYALRKNSGKNNLGYTCVYSKLGGKKRLYLKYNNYRKDVYIGKLLYIIKTGFTNSYLGLLYTNKGYFDCILLPSNKLVGDNLEGFNPLMFFSEGSTSYLRNSFLGMYVHSIEIRPSCGMKLVKAAGTSAFIYNIIDNMVTLKLNSGWLYKISYFCVGVKGNVSNKFASQKIWYKASMSRNLGFKSVVRGVAMNPVDHPHGGGEGKKSPRNFHRTP